MSRIPPNLLYLTIYNPSILPTGPIPDDDEDAEEQAHILFYTSKERAVSRDRMLRQVGLAKALINFSERFNASHPCDNVHSQSKRMIMVSPERDFWIHAGVEVAKAPRTPVDKKGKTKEKPKNSEKGKEKETEPPPLFDYFEGSVHDLSLRQDILRGYERFKLTHGSFTSILKNLGQQALELQLERFFTVWAWSWNLEDGPEIGDHLGVPLHQSHHFISRLLDQASRNTLGNSKAIFIYPPYIVPSTRYTATNYPESLPRHLLSTIPDAPSSSHETQSYDADGTVRVKRPADQKSSNGKDPPKKQDPSPSAFLGIPAVNMNMGINMDMKKWNWPGYLTFGRGTGSKRTTLDEKQMMHPLEQPTPSEQSPPPPPEHLPPPEMDPSPSLQAVHIDTNALEDAISESISFAASSTSSTGENDVLKPSSLNTPANTLPTNETTDNLPSEQLEPSHVRIPADSDSASIASSVASSIPITEPPAHPPPSPELSSISIHLTDPEDSLLTRQEKVHYILKNRMMLALVGLNKEATSDIAQSALTLLNEIEEAIATETQQLTDSVPSVSKILQPTDSHIIRVGQVTVSSSGFTSKASHLYNAQELQAMDLDISEVFSRGQNPQHWHIARRGLGANDDGTTKEGEVYMQVFRKEASLGDVDNVLAGIVRRSGLTDSPAATM